MTPAHHHRKFYGLIVGVVFAVVMGAVLAYTFMQPRLYQSSAKLEMFRGSKDKGDPDFRQMVVIIGSPCIAQEVAGRLVASERRSAFLTPYGHAPNVGVVVIGEILRKNLTIVPHPETATVDIRYGHPDRHVAAEIANMFADECLAYNVRRRIGEAMRACEALKVKAERQQQKVKALEQDLVSYREAHAATAPGALESDSAYQALLLQFAAEQKVLQELVNRMRATTMM